MKQEVELKFPDFKREIANKLE